MIKIVKVNKLYRNSSLMSIFYPCVSKRNDEISMRGKTPTCQTRNGYIYLAGERQPFLFSEVVQRYSGDEKVICWLAPLTKLIKSVEADDQRLEPFLYFTADRNSSDSLKKKINKRMYASINFLMIFLNNFRKQF